MQSASADLFSTITGIYKLWIIENLFTLHIEINTNNILIHNTTSTDVHMTDL